MKNLLLFLLLSFALTSCDNTNLLICNKDPNLQANRFIVREIKTIKDFDSRITDKPKMCVYILSTHQFTRGYIDNAYILDSINKFSIGDTIQLSANKK